MSGITNKLKDTLQQGNKTSHSEGTYNTTTSNTVEPNAPRTTATYGEPVHNTRGAATYGEPVHNTRGAAAAGTTAPIGNNYTYGSTGPAPNTDGPHKSDMLNKADPRVDSDRDYSKNMGLNPPGTADTGRNTTTTTGSMTADAERAVGQHGVPQGPVSGNTGTLHSSNNTATHGTTGGLTGSHQTAGTTASSGVREGEFGPHSSRAANAADPRVDSDLDNSRNVGSTRTTGTTGGLTGSHQTTGTTGGLTGSHQTTGTTGGLTGSHHTAGTTTTAGISEGTFGPHSSRAANAADPRVDSDLDNTRNVGATRTTGTTGGLTGSHHTAGTTGGLTGSHQTTGATGGLTGSHHTPGTTTTTSGVREGEFGPHSSRAANAADPRVDSDLDKTRNVGSTHTTGSTGHTTGTSGLSSTTGTTGHHTATTGTTGHHTTGTTGHTSNTTSGHATTGPAPNTAGPHKSDMLNKIDPRVDSNLDGSKTVGGNKTFAGSNVDTTN